MQKTKLIKQGASQVSITDPIEELLREEANQIAYWKQQLADLPTLQLPTDRPRSPMQSFRGARQCVALPQTLSEAIASLSQKEGVTLYMTLLAAFKTLLYRYTGQTDIVVGTVTAGRNQPEIQQLVGCFVNTLVLRTELKDNPTFRQLLFIVREVALEAYAYQDLPFEKLVEELQPERNLGQNPLFQVAFVLQPPMSGVDSMLNWSQLDIDIETAKFDLTLELQETPEGIVGRFEYSTDLFDAETIERMVGHFQTLLEGIIANPEQKIAELPLLTEWERQQLAAWNHTETDYPQDACIHQFFEEQVERSPDAIALVFEDEQLTYQELNKRANQLAHHLRNLGVGPEVLVGICVERSLEMIIGILGILKAGGAYVPLDPAYPPERLTFMLEDSQVAVLLTQRQLVESLPKHQAHIICLDTDWEIIERQSEENPGCSLTPDHLAYVIYTSGSTGRPKGVLVEHSSISKLATAEIRLFNVQPNSRILQFASLSFDVSVWEVVMTLLAGATLVIGTRDSLLPGLALTQLLRDLAITAVTLPPSALAVLPAEELPALQTMIVTGEAGSPDIVAKWASGRRFFNAYGPTESAVCATVAECTDSNKSLPIGRPIANKQIYLLDAQLQLVPIGVPGELYIGGDGLARGYLNRPDLTADRFIPNPFSNESGSRLYKTGDLARYLPDGNIEFLGRIDHQVKIRGFRIELGEIEAVLSQHPDVQESIVINREDGSGNQRLVAYIVSNLRPERTAVGSLRDFLKQKLPDYMMPSSFVFLNHLPLTPNGKVDRKALPAPDADAINPQLETTYVAPQTEIEQSIAIVWQEVLHLKKVGVDDSFFDLGGHSLLMAQAHSQLREVVDREVSIMEMFKYPTISSLAKYLSQEPEEKPSFGQSQGRIKKQKDAINRQKQKQRLPGKNKNG